MIGDEDDDVLLDSFDDPGDHDETGSKPSTQVLENQFGVDEDRGGIVLAKRPGSRLEVEEALNLAAWIVAVSDVDLDDFEEMVRSAVEGRE